MSARRIIIKRSTASQIKNERIEELKIEELRIEELRIEELKIEDLGIEELMDELKVEEVDSSLLLHNFEIIASPLSTKVVPDGSWAFPPLFNLDQNGKKRVWQIGYDAETNEMISEGGCFGGAIVPHSRHVVSAGGKSLAEQVYQDARMKYIKKTRKCYRLDLSDQIVRIEAQLAAKYKHPDLPEQQESGLKTTTKLNFPVFVQAKLDGIRMRVFNEHGQINLYTRGEVLYNREFFSHIIEELERFYPYLPAGWNLDGEAFTPDLTFEKISGACRAKKTYNSDIAKLKFYVFAPIITNVTTEVMYRELIKAYDNFLNDGNENQYIRVLYFQIANSHKEILDYHDQYVAAGYEGAMVRKFESSIHSAYETELNSKKFTPAAKLKLIAKYDKMKEETYYKGGRSQNLLKVKKFQEEEFKVIDIEEAQGDDRGTANLVLEMKNGNIFNCRPCGSRELRAEFWENKEKYIGKDYTVKFLRYSESGIPVPATGKGFRGKNGKVDL